MNNVNRVFQEILSDKEHQAALSFVDKLYREYGNRLIAVILFGSRARGTAETASDMDILVVLSNVDPEITRNINYLAADVWLDYDIFLSTLVWSVAHQRQVKRLKTSLYQNIVRDGVSLLEHYPTP